MIQPAIVTVVLDVLLALLGLFGVLMIMAFVKIESWLSRVVVLDALSLSTAAVLAVLAALRSDPFLLDAAILLAVAAVVGTVAVLHFMPPRGPEGS
jgi:multisubunit Na+/H+ antiporter MnhF subunit